jgi:hypothetical protein
MAIWYILRPFGIFHGYLVHSFLFWYVVPRKIWQPCSSVTKTSLFSCDTVKENRPAGTDPTNPRPPLTLHRVRVPFSTYSFSRIRRFLGASNYKFKASSNRPQKQSRKVKRDEAAPREIKIEKKMLTENEKLRP